MRCISCVLKSCQMLKTFRGLSGASVAERSADGPLTWMLLANFEKPMSQEEQFKMTNATSNNLMFTTPPSFLIFNHLVSPLVAFCCVLLDSSQFSGFRQRLRLSKELSWLRLPGVVYTALPNPPPSPINCNNNTKIYTSRSMN